MKRAIWLIALVSIVVVIIPFIPMALAAEVRTGSGAQVAAGETINDDLYLAGGPITIAGTVNGDVVAAGNSINVTGQINGNLFAFAQSISVSGKVDGGLFAAGQTISLSGVMTHTARLAGQSILVQGPVGRDLLAAGQSVIVESSSSIGQDLLLAAQDGRIMGTVRRRVQGSVDSLTIAGRVGDVDVEAQQLAVASGARVGSLTYRSEKEARIESGAAVSGPVTRLEPEPRAERRAPSWTDRIVPGLWWFISTLIVGAVLAWLVPAALREPAAALRDRPWHSLGWGFILFIVTPIAVIIALVTLVGILVGLLVLFAYGAALFLSQIFVGAAIGQLILQQWQTGDPWSQIGRLALGLAVLLIALAVLGLIPVLGGLAVLATLVAGLGAAWIAAGRARFGERRRPEAA